MINEGEYEMNAKYSLVSKDNKAELLFSNILEMWLSLNEVKVKKSTYDKYSYMIEKHIYPELGNMQLNKINAITINKFVKQKLICGSIEEHEPLSPSYVSTMVIIIKSALDYAEKEKIYSGLNNPIYKPSKKNSEFNILTPNEINVLETYLNQHLGNTEIGVLLALFTGLRIGEVCALEWNNVDLKNRVIHIKSTVSRVKIEGKYTNIIGPPKTESSLRDIPIPNKLYKNLKVLYKERQSEFVISDKTSFVYPRTYEYRYHKILKAAQITDINFHSLRHTFATYCISNGMDVKSLSEILGHASTNITMQRYVHPSLEMKRKQLEMALN